MVSRSARQRWTYAEFARLPSAGSARQEVIDGDLVVTPAPGLRHQAIVMHLAWLLYGFVREHDAGMVFGSPVDILLDEGDYLEPDIVYVRRDRANVLTDRGIEGPPDLVVEVISHSTAQRDRGVKLERYRHHGVPAYWIVDPDARCVEVWDLASGARKPVLHRAPDTLRWRVREEVPELAIDLAELFESASA